MNAAKAFYFEYGTLVMFCIIVLITIVAGILVGKYLQSKLLEKTLHHAIDITSFVFIKHMIVTTIYLLGFGWAFLTLPITHTFAHSLLAGAGATTLIIGFASQQIFNNVLSGIFLVLNKPFQINDIIEFQGVQGKVAEINLNATILQNEKGDRIIIPSSLLLTDKIKKVNQGSTSSSA